VGPRASLDAVQKRKILSPPPPGKRHTKFHDNTGKLISRLETAEVVWRDDISSDQNEN
jgi:hypothetical protein